MAELFEILGRAAMRLGSPTVQQFNDTTYEVITPFDTVTVERGGITADHLTNEITVNQDGLYEVFFGIDADFDKGDQLDILIYVNGAAYSNNPAAVQGLGDGKPLSITWGSLVNLNAGDVIDMRCKNGASGNFDCNFRRLFFSVKADS